MARTAKIILASFAGGAVTGYTLKGDDLVAANVTDTASAATGLTVNYSAVPSTLDNGSYASGDRHTYTQQAIQQTTAYTSTNFDVIIDGTLSGEKISTIKLWGCSLASDTGRQTDFTIGATTLSHDARDGGLAAPVEFTVDSSTLPVTITVAKKAGASFGYASMVEVELVASGPTITNITNPITTGGNATLTGNFPGATLGNTTVTQDGVALTVVSANETTIVVTTVDVESSALKYGTHTFEVTIV